MKFVLALVFSFLLIIPTSYADDITDNLQEGDEVVLMFSTSWCGPCQILKRRLKTEEVLVLIIKDRYENRFYILDAESAQYAPLARRLRVRAYPTIFRMIFENSKLKLRRTFIGANLTARWLNEDLD